MEAQEGGNTDCIEESSRRRSRWLFVTTLYWMAVALLVKMLSVWLYSSRGNEHCWPFDSFLFQAKDRLTDYLVPWTAASP